MFNATDEEKEKSWLPYILGMTATAILTTVGSELVRWGVDELKKKYGKKDKETATSDNKETISDLR